MEHPDNDYYWRFSVGDRPKTGRLEPVDPFAATEHDTDQTRVLQDAQMPRRRRPRAVEARRDRTGRHLATAGVEPDNQAPIWSVLETVESEAAWAAP